MSNYTIQNILRQRAAQSIAKQQQGQQPTPQEAAAQQYIQKQNNPRAQELVKQRAYNLVQAKENEGRVYRSSGSSEPTYYTNSLGQRIKVTAVSRSVEGGGKVVVTSGGKATFTDATGKKSYQINQNAAQGFIRDEAKNASNLSGSGGIDETNSKFTGARPSPNQMSPLQQSGLSQARDYYAGETIKPYGQSSIGLNANNPLVQSKPNKPSAYSIIDAKIGGILPGGSSLSPRIKNAYNKTNLENLESGIVADIKRPNVWVPAPLNVLSIASRSFAAGMGEIFQFGGKVIRKAGEKSNIDSFTNLGGMIERNPFKAEFATGALIIGGGQIYKATGTVGNFAFKKTLDLTGKTWLAKTAAISSQTLTSAGISQALRIQTPLYDKFFLSKDSKNLLSQPGKKAEFENVILPLGFDAATPRTTTGNWFKDVVSPKISWAFESVMPFTKPKAGFNLAVTDYATSKGYDPALYLSTASGLKRSRDITLFTRLIQPEISANAMAKYSPKRFWAGFQEASVGFNAVLDYRKSVNVPFTNGAVKFTSGWKPYSTSSVTTPAYDSFTDPTFKNVTIETNRADYDAMMGNISINPKDKTNKIFRVTDVMQTDAGTITTTNLYSYGIKRNATTSKTYNIGKSASLPVVGIFGGLTASSFRSFEKFMGKTKAGRVVSDTVGYGLDFPEEPIGDLLSIGGTGSTKTFTNVMFSQSSPRKGNIYSFTKSSSKTSFTSTFNDVMGLSKSKSYSNVLNFASSPTKTSSNAFSNTKTNSFVTSFVNTKTNSNTKTQTDSFTDTFVNSEAMSNSFTDVFSNAMVMTPKIFIPPVLPSGGGGSGGFGYSKGFKRMMQYQPSLYGIYKGKRRSKGILTGLEIRGL